MPDLKHFAGLVGYFLFALITFNVLWAMALLISALIFTAWFYTGHLVAFRWARVSFILIGLCPILFDIATDLPFHATRIVYLTFPFLAFTFAAGAAHLRRSLNG